MLAAVSTLLPLLHPFLGGLSDAREPKLVILCEITEELFYICAERADRAGSNETPGLLSAPTIL